MGKRSAKPAAKETTRTAKRPAKRKLSEYDAKRDFTKSPEPRPVVKAAKTKDAKTLFFCVQKHLASHLHYDLRLEHGGVLLSWAVPKGPSLNPADKRMAMHVEDHPYDYGEFEGVIPSGYGAGVVVLWDRGTWTPEAATGDVDAALKRGELKFRLDGVKLKGSWVLVRTHGRFATGKAEPWLLIKHRDEWSGDVDVTTLAPLSVKTFGDLPDVLARHEDESLWHTTPPPVKGGETGKLFRDVIARAQEIRASGGAKSSSKGTKGSKKKKRAPGDVWHSAPRGTGFRPVKAEHGLKTRATRSARKSDSTLSPTLAPAALTFGTNKPKFSNLNKVLYPTGFTKGQVIDYYTRVAPLILPQLAGRAITLKRYPDGVNGEAFFEKRCPDHRPPWVKTIRVPGKNDRDKTIDYCELGDLSSLVWAANLAAIELHVPLALGADPETATTMVFDLDPGPPASIKDCVVIARRLKALLDQLGLTAVIKTSGGKGLHVLVPLNTPGITFDDTKNFSRAVALTLERDDPKRVIASMAKVARAGKVFIDWGQNDRNKTTVGLFSLRARETPSVSWPFDWSLLDERDPPGPFRADQDLDLAEAGRVVGALTRRQALPRV